MGELGSEVEINAVSKAIVVVRDDRQSLGRVQQEKHITTELNSPLTQKWRLGYAWQDRAPSPQKPGAG